MPEKNHRRFYAGWVLQYDGFREVVCAIAACSQTLGFSLSHTRIPAHDNGNQPGWPGLKRAPRVFAVVFDVPGRRHA